MNGKLLLGFHFDFSGRARWLRVNISYLPAGRSVLAKTVPEVLNTARGRKPRAVLKTGYAFE